MITDFNMDFTKNISINTQDQEMVPSPAQGVSRIPLEREGQESGRTTSIVRYEAGANFKSHTHPKGEEIYVLEGIFSDESGDYPAGTYIRSPSGYSHAPFSKEGCLIFVKLNHFQDGDLERIIINTNSAEWSPGYGNLEVMPLHSFQEEGTALVKWPNGERFQPHRHLGGEEILVLSGEFKDEHGDYPKGTWIRNKHLSQHNPWVDKETVILVKTGHLLK